MKYKRAAARQINRRAGVGWLAVLAIGLALVGCSLNGGQVQDPGAAGETRPAVLTQPAVETLPAAEIQPAETAPPPAAASPQPGAVLATPEPGVSTAGETVELDPQAALLTKEDLDVPALTGAGRYAIDLKLDFAEHRFDGRMQLETTNREDIPLDELYFRLLPNSRSSYGDGSLTVSRATVDGQPVEMELSNSNTVLRVELGRSLAPGEQALVEMDFSGQVPADFGGAGSEVGYGIYNFSENVLSLAGWYPILAVYDEDGWNLDPVSDMGDSVYSDAAFYAVQVDAPADVVIAASGVETGRQVTGDTAQTLFQSGPVRDFYLIASPDFATVSRTVDGTEVKSHYLPGYETAGRQALEITADSLEIFNRRFGMYPYRELDVAQAPLRYALGVEFPGIFLVGSDLYNKPDGPDFQVATAHETAHQWWYNVVGNDVFDEPWLDEGLTTYSSSLYYEDALGEDYRMGLVDYWQKRYNKLRSDGEDDQVTQPLGYFETLGRPRVYGGVVYTKAALFFDALRQEIGDAAFFAALQAYYQAHRYGTATAPDLLGAFEAAAGRSLQDFYQIWLYQKGP